MRAHSVVRSAARFLGATAGIAAGAYAATVGVAWYRYGSATRPTADECDELLDRFIPEYDVVERHRVRIAAPAAVTFEAAKEMDLARSWTIRTIFRAREVILGARPDQTSRPRGVFAQMLSLGWVVLAEMPGREVVVGAVTKPWEPDVVFRSVPPEAFARFAEPDYVKIVWTLRADDVDATTSTFRTETRAIATDAAARTKFRRYWSFVSPGIFLIRWLSLGPLRADVERRWRDNR